MYDLALETIALRSELSDRLRAALDYEAPWLVEKLLKEHIVSSAEEAEDLFLEVKRYLVLGASDRSRTWMMPSSRVDEVWHQFVLFSVEYTQFCERFIGHYSHHFPSNSPSMMVGESRTVATFEELAERYEELFGVPLGEIWRDDLAIFLGRRLIWNDVGGPRAVAVTEDGAELRAAAEDDPTVLVRTDAWGAPALAFLARHEAFYVRELPAPLSDEDKIALAQALVHAGRLRVAP